MTAPNKQALRMRNYLDTALKSGGKLLHLSTDELEGLLDENLQLQRDKDSLEAVAIAMRDDMREAREKLEAAEKRIADQRGIILSARKFISEYAQNGDAGAAEFVKILDRAAGIGVKGE